MNFHDLYTFLFTSPLSLNHKMAKMLMAATLLYVAFSCTVYYFTYDNSNRSPDNDDWIGYLSQLSDL